MFESNQHSWTYTPTDPEREYLNESLDGFFEDNWLTDILYKVRVGKEATCYCCRAAADSGLDFIAAKVYRPSAFRAMRNDWYYRIGKTMTTGGRGAAYRGRVLRALRKHTRFGKHVERVSWSGNEFDLLGKLHRLGAEVPKPLASSDSAILMEFFGDEVRGAPTLHMVALDPPEARNLFDRVIGNVETMLREHLVHADLSAHNILYWNGDVRVIDFPQAVSADRHPGAFELLSRDVDRVCKYFAKQGIQSDPIGLSIDLWQRLQQGRL
jgi:RIO kinase 1